MRDSQVTTFLQQWTGTAGGLISSQKPNDHVKLSAVLVSNAPAKYFLSQKAAAGILRRAAKRGKTLPPALKLALEQVAGTNSPPPSQPEAGALNGVANRADRTA